MKKKHIVIIGLGGVGGYFGFKLSQTNETTQQHQISFVARKKTYEVVKDQGLTLLSPEHSNNKTNPDHIYQLISEIENPDLILICVKEYDLEHVCNQLCDIINPETIILPMMNGADIYDRIKAIIPNNTVLPSCVYVASHIKEKGIVEHKGNPGKLIFGRDPMNFSTDIHWVINLINNSTVTYKFKDSVLIDIWTKFIFIASFGLVTAKHNSSIGTVCNNHLQKEEARKIMEEIKSIAIKKDIHLGENIIANTFKKAASFPPTTPTSLQLDVNSGKENNELELFAGAIINYGKACHILTPYTSKIYQEIKELQSAFFSKH